MSNNKNRTAANAVSQEVDERKLATEARLVELRQDLDEAQRHIQYLEKEGKRRHNGTSAQLGRTVAELKQLEARYGSLSRELADIKSSDNPIIAQGNLADLESINNRLEAFEELPGKVRSLREDVSELQATVTGLDVRTSNNEHKIGNLETSQSKLTHRVFNLEQQFQEKAPWAALVLGVLVAVATLWIRFTFVSRETTQMLPDGDTIQVPDPNFVFNTWIMAGAFGAIAAGLVVLLGLFASRRSRTATDYDVSTPVHSQVSNTPTPRQQTAEEAPTKKLPVTEQLVDASASGVR